jgi:beta-fructofuranosidase
MSPFRRPTVAAAAGDPIPFAFGDETHLFYLSSPSGTEDYPERVRTSWQHAVSKDLVEWTELPTAVEPGPVGSYDGGGIWTGSVVEKAGTFYLFYTGHHVGAENPQTICLATSDDLVNFVKHPGNPLVLPVSGTEPVDWRDPYVFFNEQEQKWWMLIAARERDGAHWRRGCIMLATSSDLLDWTVEPEPFYSPGDTYCPECPELWELGGRWYLVYSRFSENVGTIYRVADNPRGPFRIPANEELGGRRWYASKSAPVADGRAFFGWIHDRVDGVDGSRWLWGGDFALPRIVSSAGEALVVRPSTGAFTPWGSVLAQTSGMLGSIGGGAETTVFEELPASSLSTVTIQPGNSAIAGIDLLSDNQRAAWRISVNLASGGVQLSKEPRPLDDFWADLTGRAGDYREVDGPVLAFATIVPHPTQLVVSVVLDGELLEIYVNDEIALTQRIRYKGALDLGVFVLDGEIDYTVAVAGP